MKKLSKNMSKKKLTKRPAKNSRLLPIVVVLASLIAAFAMVMFAQMQQETRSRAESAKGTTKTLNPQLDTYISLTSSIDNSKAKSLRIKGGKKNLSMAMLTFDLSSVPQGAKITSAKLKMHTNNESDAMSDDSYPIHVMNPLSALALGADDTGDEFKKQLEKLETRVGKVKAGSKNKWYTYSLQKKPMEQFAGKTVVFIIGDIKGDDGVWFDSSETSKKPSLEIKYKTD
jgi:hypothetical protein